MDRKIIIVSKKTHAWLKGESLKRGLKMEALTERLLRFGREHEKILSRKLSEAQ